MFIVKRLGRNGMWNAVSLIDENGSFRGEAKFDTVEEAKVYLATYLARMKARLREGADGGLQVRVFDETGEPVPEASTERPKKTRKKSSKQKKSRKKLGSQ